MISCFRRTALPSLFFFLFANVCLAAPDAAPLALSADGGEAATATFDLGDINQASQPQITHTFLLRNEGTRSLTIVRLQPSCECTSVSLLPQADLPKTIPPGGEASVCVSVIVEPYFNGALHQFAQVFVDGRDSALATLKLTATMHPMVVTDPLALDFGTGPAGAARSQTVTATIDARLAPASGSPILVAADPDIQITPLPALPPASPNTRAYAYRVTLAANAALGPVNDLLQFATASGAASIDGMALSDGPGVVVTGLVTGSASATPEAVAFGVVTQGQSKTLPIRVDAAPAVLASAQATAASPFLRVRWAKTTGQTRLLYVALAAAAPAGPLRSTVVITLGNGQRFRLSVSGYVSGT